MRGSGSTQSGGKNPLKPARHNPPPPHVALGLAPLLCDVAGNAYPDAFQAAYRSGRVLAASATEVALPQPETVAGYAEGAAPVLAAYWKARWGGRVEALGAVPAVRGASRHSATPGPGGSRIRWLACRQGEGPPRGPWRARPLAARQAGPVQPRHPVFTPMCCRQRRPGAALRSRPARTWRRCGGCKTCWKPRAYPRGVWSPEATPRPPRRRAGGGRAPPERVRRWGQSARWGQGRRRS